MSEHEELSKKLLAENGLSAGPLAQRDREELRSIVEAERRRAGEAGKIACLLWSAFFALLVISLAIYFAAGDAGPAVQIGEATLHIAGAVGALSMLLASITFIVALVATVAWGLRLALGPRGAEERLERIEQRLARLEAAQTKASGIEKTGG